MLSPKREVVFTTASVAIDRLKGPTCVLPSFRRPDKSDFCAIWWTNLPGIGISCATQEVGPTELRLLPGGSELHEENYGKPDK